MQTLERFTSNPNPNQMIKKTTFKRGQTLDQPWVKLQKTIYKDLGFKPDEQEKVTEWLFDYYSRSHKIIIYEVVNRLSLVGIFPYESKTGYFAYWETVDNQSINRDVFRELEKDARDAGIAQIKGPLHFNTYHRYRLRLGKTPSWSSFDMEPVNPTYYPSILEKVGYEISDTFESHYLEHDTIYNMYQSIKKYKKQHPDHLKILPLTQEVWNTYYKQFYDLTTEIFSQNSNYQMVLRQEFELLYNEVYASGLCPYSSSVIIDSRTSQLASLSLCRPNFAGLKETFQDFEEGYQNLTKPILLAKTVGTHPKYRGNNLMNAMGIYGTEGFINRYDGVIFCLMKSNNPSQNFTKHLKHEKARYGLFMKNLS